jgi:hypothetical protein
MRRVSPTERMLTVLALLATEPAHTWEVGRLRRDVPGYEAGAAGDRNWHFDSQALRARGLITTGVNSRATPNRTGVRYALPAKPGDLHLSTAEHASLARLQVARAGALSSPLGGDTSRGVQMCVSSSDLAPPAVTDFGPMRGERRSGESWSRSERRLRYCPSPLGRRCRRWRVSAIRSSTSLRKRSGSRASSARCSQSDASWFCQSIVRSRPR